jgi:hypothetical protein
MALGSWYLARGPGSSPLAGRAGLKTEWDALKPRPIPAAALRAWRRSLEHPAKDLRLWQFWVKRGTGLYLLGQYEIESVHRRKNMRISLSPSSYGLCALP